MSLGFQLEPLQRYCCILIFFSSLDILPVAFNAVFTLSGLSFYWQLLEQLDTA